MFETKIKQKNLRNLIYFLGAIFEVIGFALLFSFDKTMNLIYSYKIIFSIFLIIAGYLIAVGGRKI